jgi:WD40 repeat protein
VATHDTFVLTGSADDTIRKWDMSTCECLEIYEGHTSRVFRVICTEDWIFSTSYDATARAWRFDTSDLDEEEDPCVRIFKVCALFRPSKNFSALTFAKEKNKVAKKYSISENI